MVLNFPDFSKPFVIYTDASGVAVGHVLMQKDDHSKLRPLYFGGRSLKNAELRYSTTEKEALAIIHTLKSHFYMLHGSQLDIHTDHKPLLGYFKCHNPKNGRLARWISYLDQFSYNIHYVEGKANLPADYISRTINVVAIGLPTNLDDWKVAAAQYLEDNAHKGKTHLDEHGMLKIWVQSNELFWVPPFARKELIRENHASSFSGHLNVEIVYKKLKERYFWDGMYKDCVRFIKNCIDCLQRKATCARTQRSPRNKAFPWKELAIDIVGPILVSINGNRFILTILDRFTGWAEAFALPSVETPIIVKTLMDNVFSRFGLPKLIFSDNGPNFVSNLMKEFCKFLGVKTLTAPVYAPYSNGAVERFNRTLADGISMLIKNNPKDWDARMNVFLMAHRSMISGPRKHSAFEMMFGRVMNLPSTLLTVSTEGNNQTYTQYVQWLKTTLEKIRRVTFDAGRRQS